MTINRAVCFAALLSISVASVANAEKRWAQWRGPLGTGVSNETTLPIEWTVDDVAWKTELPGKGQSSPTVWDDRIYLTSATDDGRGRVVMCLQRSDGTILWEKTAWTGDPEESHSMNGWAASTCATDGERVVAFFGRGGLHCFDMDGKPLWSRDLGKFEGPWGTGASPVIIDDLVIQNCDADDAAYLLGVNKDTGKDVWRTERLKKRGWSTPVLVTADGRRELIINGHLGMNAYDPKSGKELWFCKGDWGRGEPTVVTHKDIVIAVSGRPGDMFSVRPGGNGTVTETHGGWRTPRKTGRDLPSPVVVDDYLMVMSMQPFAYCYDATNGELLDKQRLKGRFIASPIAAGGLIYVPNESGSTFVIRPGKIMEIVAVNTVGSGDEEVFRASLTPCEGQLLCRSDRVLYCIGRKPTQ